MKSPRLGTVVATAVLGLALVGAEPMAAGAGPSFAAAHGFTWFLGSPSAIKPAGMPVFVRAGASARLTDAAKYAVAQQQHYGVKLVWSGTSSSSTRAGAVVIRQAASCAAGLGGQTTTVPAGTAVPDVVVVASSFVKLCPVAFQSSAVLRASVLHELGHAVGLNHISGYYKGHKQIMNTSAQSEDRTYQRGDINGLRAVAANTRRLAAVRQ